MTTSSKTFIITAGVAVWVPLLFSFLGAVSLTAIPGIAISQTLMVLCLITATLLLGVLIGKTALTVANR
jgi:hypothetical protein